MNSLMNLLARYAAADRLRVDAREWLLFLELDPTRAAEVLRHLTILAAEDTAIVFTAAAADALRAAAGRGATPGGADPAVASLHGVGHRLAQAHQRAATIWSTQLLPQLVQACVLTPSTGPDRPPECWQPATVSLPESTAWYPAQVATRRHRGSHRQVRVTLSTCRRVAGDLATSGRWQPDPPLIVVDDDRPALLIGVDDLDTAWARDADVTVTDTAGRVTLPTHWPWRTSTTSARPPLLPAHPRPTAARRPPIRITTRPGHHAANHQPPCGPASDHGTGSTYGSTT
jgi:hypothetical protein